MFTKFDKPNAHENNNEKSLFISTHNQSNKLRNFGVIIMGTRAVISYKDYYTSAFLENQLSLYTQYDGNPDGISQKLLSALDDIYTIEHNYQGQEVAFWQNNTRGGMYTSTIRAIRNISPTTSPEAHGDLEFRYLVESSKEHGWTIDTYERKDWDGDLELAQQKESIKDFINAGQWTHDSVATFNIDGNEIPFPISKLDALLNNARIQAGKYTPDNPNTKTAMKYVEALEAVKNDLENKPSHSI